MSDFKLQDPEISRFYCSLDSIDKADVVLAGFPYDSTASFRAGARFGPSDLRNYAIDKHETFSYYFKEDLSRIKYFDAGDVEKLFGNPGIMLPNYKRIAHKLMDGGKRLVGIGGDHLIHYPLWKAAEEKYGSFTVIHLDAHADVCDVHMGEAYTHGSVMRRCLDDGCPKIIQYGIRCLYEDEYEFISNESRVVSVDSVAEIAAEVNDNENVYISIDVDFFDPSFVPGTGTPEAGGKSFHDFIDFLRMIRTKNLNIIGANIVELAPYLDPTKNSTIFVSRILREFLLCF